MVQKMSVFRAVLHQFHSPVQKIILSGPDESEDFADEEIWETSCVETDS